MLDNQKYIDIKVIDGGWHIDAGQQPQACSNLYSIAQDIKHAIMESGLARMLIAERSPILRSDVLIQIEQVAESDVRIIPGTATATELSPGEIILTADTYEFESLSVDVQNPIQRISIPVTPIIPPVPEAFTGVQIGELIITPETVWHDSNDIPAFTLLTAVAEPFDMELYPQLAQVYPTGIKPYAAQVEGSPFPFKVVADYTGESNA